MEIIIITDYQILGVLDIEPGNRLIRHLLSRKIELLYGKAWFEKVSTGLFQGMIPLNL